MPEFPARRRSTIAHGAARLFARCLALLPRMLRWRLLLLISAPAAVLIRHAETGQERGLGIDGYREIALWRLMVAAGEVGLEFDPSVRHRGGEHLETALASGRGVLAAGPHALLLFLVVRDLHDRGADPVVISSGADRPVFGTRIRPRFIPFAPAALGEAVRHLRLGDVVCAMIDRSAPEKGTFAVETGLGEVHVSTPLLRFALRERAAVLLCCARVVDGAVEVSWAAPLEPGGDARLRADIGGFIRDRIGEGQGRGGPRALARSCRRNQQPGSTGLDPSSQAGRSR